MSAKYNVNPYQVCELGLALFYDLSQILLSYTHLEN